MNDGCLAATSPAGWIHSQFLPARSPVLDRGDARCEFRSITAGASHDLDLDFTLRQGIPPSPANGCGQVRPTGNRGWSSLYTRAGARDQQKGYSAVGCAGRYIAARSLRQRRAWITQPRCGKASRGLYGTCCALPCPRSCSCSPPARSQRCFPAPTGPRRQLLPSSSSSSAPRGPTRRLRTG